MREKILKKTYKIDMEGLMSKPIVELNVAGYVELPTTGKHHTPNTASVLFKADEIRTMIEQYKVLFPMIQEHASTITEFVRTNNEQILTIFPNGNLDFHKGQIFSLNIDNSDKTCIVDALEKSKKRITGLNGVLRNYQRK